MTILVTHFFKQIIPCMLLVCLCIPVFSQNNIDINASCIENIQMQESDIPVIKLIFNEVERYRPFNFNKQLATLSANNIGDTLSLAFFNDKQYKSVIQNVTLNHFGRTSITSKITDTEFGYCFMVVSENTITISAELPQNNECFFASVKNGQAYISQVTKSVLDASALEGTELIVPKQSSQSNENNSMNSKGIDDPVVIDVLMVYTPAAEEWALEDYRVTDIFDLIDQALQRSNTAMENSNSGIIFNIVHTHLTDYVEDNTVEDLYRITDPWDGYMDEVHVLRDMYYADEIVFIPKVDFTGGVAWLLNDPYGFYPDNYAVALSRVQQSSWTYTVVHEVGHNMGCHHHIDQNYQPGPGLFYFSSGWRGTISSNNVCTVMTYEGGDYFADGVTHYRIPYFSSPDITVDGVQIGDPVLADNTYTLKLTKTAVANYRNAPEPSLSIYPSSVNFYDVVVNTTSVATVSVIGTNLSEPITYNIDGSDFNAFNITQISWNPLTGGTLSITFLPTEQKDFYATIIFSATGVPNKEVALSGKGIPASYTIFATAGENGVIMPEGEIQVISEDSVEFIFIPNFGYDIKNVMVDGISNQNAVENGSFMFSNVSENHTIHVEFYNLSVNEDLSYDVKIFSYLNFVVINNPEALHKAHSAAVEIFDITGRLVFNGNISDVKTVIPLQVSKGIYSVKLFFSDENIIMKKVLFVK